MALGYLKRKAIRLIPPGRPVTGSIVLPGSKSFTNRALVNAALASGESVLHGASRSEDTEVLIDALEKLGVLVNKRRNDLVVCGSGGRFDRYHGLIDVGAAGTSMRFLISVCALVEGGDITLYGSERMHQRPVGDLVEAWRELGTDIAYLENEGCPPLRIRGTRAFRSNRVRMSGGTA